MDMKSVLLGAAGAVVVLGGVVAVQAGANAQNAALERGVITVEAPVVELVESRLSAAGVWVAPEPVVEVVAEEAPEPEPASPIEPAPEPEPEPEVTQNPEPPVVEPEPQPQETPAPTVEDPIGGGANGDPGNAGSDQ